VRAALVVVLLTAASWSFGGAATTAARVAEAPVGELRHCGSRGDSTKPARPPTPVGARIGPLVIWPSSRTRVEPYAREQWRYYVKAPIILPARTKAVLAVAARATSLAAFHHRDGFVSAIRFEACPERTPSWGYAGRVGKYTSFPFGFVLTRRPACVPMELWIDGEAAPIRRLVPFGRRDC
jgi:hypothetical protein